MTVKPRFSQKGAILGDEWARTGIAVGCNFVSVVGGDYGKRKVSEKGRKYGGWGKGIEA